MKSSQRHKYSLKSQVLYFLVLVSFLIYSNAYAAVYKTKITDTNGKIYEVSGLYAEYLASGFWQGSQPRKTKKGIPFVIVTEEDRVTHKDNIEIPFSEIQRITFKHTDVVWKYTINILKKDGTIIEYSNDKGNYIERNREGSIISSKKATLSAGSIKNYSYSLNHFKGHSKSKSGREGEFSIFYGEVHRIDFE